MRPTGGGAIAGTECRCPAPGSGWRPRGVDRPRGAVRGAEWKPRGSHFIPPLLPAPFSIPWLNAIPVETPVELADQGPAEPIAGPHPRRASRVRGVPSPRPGVRQQVLEMPIPVPSRVPSLEWVCHHEDKLASRMSLRGSSPRPRRCSRPCLGVQRPQGLCAIVESRCGGPRAHRAPRACEKLGQYRGPLG